MISECSHSSRKRTTPANRTNRAITPGANLPIPMAVPASRADSLPLRGRRNPSAAAAAGTARAPAPASPSDAGTAFPRPDLRFRHPGRVLSGDRRCPQADDERKQPHQRPGQGQRGTGLSGIYPGRRQPACAGTDPDKREFFHAAQQRRHLLYFGGIPDPRPGLRTGRISKEAIK